MKIVALNTEITKSKLIQSFTLMSFQIMCRNIANNWDALLLGKNNE